MYEFHPYYTCDGSVGLYSPEFNDIYHSASGALTEAYEKFVLPADIGFLLNNKQKIKLLDICYGIGYNTKVFLNYIFENYSQKFSLHANYYEPIYTNNQFNGDNINYAPIHTNKTQDSHEVYNDEIHTDKVLPEISITAVDNDEKLFFLSPFIKTGEKNYALYNLEIPSEKIHKYLSEGSGIKIKNIDTLVNFLIFEQITAKFPQIYKDFDINNILSDKKLAPFFDKRLTGIFDFNKSRLVKSTLSFRLPAFLHNIYYHHVSSSYKIRLKTSILGSINIGFKNGDAREIIKNDKNVYNLIFLDAFTPSKCPCLWSYDFFKLLFDRIEPDGMLLTYSSSAAVRSAMMQAGFTIGNIYSERENKYIGTVGVKNQALIKYPLSEFDSGLLKTKAGIFYRDENLNGQNESIIALRNFEVNNSTKQSSSEFKKLFKS